MPIVDDLLSRGFLPVQLPPGFSSTSFAQRLGTFRTAWDAIRPPLTIPARFSVAKSSFYRRKTAIINPVSFYYLAREIDTYWPMISAHYAQSPLSKSVPTIGPGLRAIQLRKFSALYEDKIVASGAFRYALITDISSFFPTIYTHSIPWALHTKTVAKQNRNPTPQYFGNILDERCRTAQDGQTIGIAIGPDTSHIVAEIIAVSIDLEIRARLGAWPAGFRYVDDYFFFFNTRDEAEKALAVLANAVSGYELMLNPAKTRIVSTRELIEESWKYGLREMKISPKRLQQRDDIHRYFELLFSLEKRFQDESLIKYGLKLLSSRIIKRSNWDVTEAYLLKCGYSFPNSLQVIAHLLATYNHFAYPLDKVAITLFCRTLLASTLSADQHGEVAWLLWICKELALKLDVAVLKAVLQMGNPACTLIALDIRNRGLAPGALNKASLRQYATSQSLRGPDWILSYEAGRRRWLGVNDRRFITSDPFFGPLLAARVHFYDELTTIAPIFHFKEPDEDEDHFNFDSDDEVEDRFEFDEIDEEYFDAAVDEDDEQEDEDDEEPDDDGELY